jgi:glycine/D-amino acid oxidase-like deaminating enzyme
MADHARAVIIGGGVGGTSIAYHLTELAGPTSSCSTGLA